MSNSSSHLYAVILAGGTGTRLWPRSRRQEPKQLLNLFSARTMLQETYDRVAPLIEPDRVYVLTNAAYVNQVCEQLPQIPAENVIGEPVGRGTAPPVGLAGVLLRERDPQAVMVSLHSDHYIQRNEEFRRVLCAAEELAEQGCLVTLGIVPRYPETGYGYIQVGAELAVVRGLQARQVRRFTEKPDAAAAAQFVASGEYLWNSGIFIWRADVIVEEFARFLPELAGQLTEIVAARGQPDADEVMARVWREIKSETIDVGIMEKSSRVGVLPLDVGWSDVGNWATLLDLLPGDANHNVIQGDHIGVDTKSSLIYGKPGRLIATVGVEDMIIVDAGDVLLVCPKSQAQRVKDLIDELRRCEQDEYL